MPDLVKASGEVVPDVLPDEAMKLVTSGEMGVDADQTYNMVGEGGDVIEVPGSSLKYALDQKYRFAHPEEVRMAEAKTRLESKYTPAAEKAAAVAHGLIGGAIFNTPADLATRALAGDNADEAMQEVSDLRAVHPALTGAGELGGFLGTAGLGLVAKGLGAPKAIAGALGGASTALEGAGAVGKFLGSGAARLFGAGEGAAQVAGTVGRLGAEGATFGLDKVADESVLGDPQTAAESAFTVGKDALINVAVGGVLHGALNRKAASAAFDAALEAGASNGDALRSMLETALGPHVPAGAVEDAAKSIEATADEALSPAGRSAETQAKIEAEATRAARYNQHPATKEVVEALSTLDKSAEAQARRAGVFTEKESAREAEKAAVEMTDAFERVKAAQDSLARNNARGLKEAHLERMMDGSETGDAISKAASLSNTLSQGMRTLVAEAAESGVASEAKTIVNRLELGADRVLAKLEADAPDVMSQFYESQRIKGIEEAAAARKARNMRYEGTEYGAEVVGKAAKSVGIEALRDASATSTLSRFGQWAKQTGALDNLPSDAAKKIKTTLFREIEVPKQQLGPLAFGHSDTARPVGVSSLRNAYGAMREFLERADVWGDAVADAQRDVNVLQSQRIQLEGKFKSMFLDAADKAAGAKPEKMLALFRATTKFADTSQKEQMFRYVELLAKEAETVAERFGTGSAEAKEARQAAETFATTFRKSLDRVELINLAREVRAQGIKDTPWFAKALGGGNNLGMLTVDAAIGHALGGLTGAGLGVMTGMAVSKLAGKAVRNYYNPMERIVEMTAREHVAKKLSQEAESAVSQFFKKASEKAGRTVGKYAGDTVKRFEEIGTKAINNGYSGDLETIGRGSLAKAYVGAATIVKKAKENRKDVTASLIQGWSGGDEAFMGTTKALVDHADSVIDYLTAQMPPAVQTNPFRAPMLGDGVTRQQAAEFVQKATVAFDPMTAIHALGDGTITKGQAEALKACYPKTYEQVQQHIMSGMADVEGDIPYNKAVSLSTLFGVPVAESMKPDFIARMQAAYMSDDQPDPSNDGNGPGRGRPRGPAPKLASQMMTGAQSIEARAST